MTKTAGSPRCRPFRFCVRFRMSADGGVTRRRDRGDRLTAPHSFHSLISLYHGPRFLLECAVRGDAVVVKYLYRS
jgi:hypothetical protein